MEYMPDFDLHRPTGLEDAVRLGGATDGARYLAGGTDMIVNVRRGIEQPKALIDLSAIEELKAIHDDGEALVIGAGLVTDTASPAHTDRRIPVRVRGTQ